MSENTLNENTLDDLLDMSLDDLADLPEFKLLPVGAHVCTMELASKVVNDKPSIELKLKLIETKELANPAEEPCEVGTESSQLFDMTNEFGQGKFKNLAKPLAIHFGVTKTSELIEQSKGAEVLVVVKHRQNKEKTATYMDVINLQVI